MFAFIPEAQQHYFFVVPLLPFDFFCGDQLLLTDIDDVRQAQRVQYKSMTLQVDSCPYPLFFADSNEQNLRKFERLGDVEMVRHR